jgi:hypothetical protein
VFIWRYGGKRRRVRRHAPARNDDSSAGSIASAARALVLSEMRALTNGSDEPLPISVESMTCTHTAPNPCKIYRPHPLLLRHWMMGQWVSRTGRCRAASTCTSTRTRLFSATALADASRLAAARLASACDRFVTPPQSRSSSCRVVLDWIPMISSSDSVTGANGASRAAIRTVAAVESRRFDGPLDRCR